MSNWNVPTIDQRKLHKIISKPWATDCKNFSDRIWQNKTKLTNELHNKLTRMCMLGGSPDKAIKNKSMNISAANAGKLIMTESSYFASAAQKDLFNDLNVECFEVVETLDGKVFDMTDFKPGVTAPPFHPWCRGCTIRHFDDEFSFGERAARGHDGKTYCVPDSMRFPEWKKSFVN